MLRTSETRKRLPVILSPAGEFYTPTYEGYSEAEAMPKLLVTLFTKKRQYFWQKVVPETRRSFVFFRREVWVPVDETMVCDTFPRGWIILQGRPFRTPEALTPAQARAEASRIGG